MPVSEKTVELNLTTELINWFGNKYQRVCYALAPSQRQEGQLGFDTSIQVSGGALLIQYKRAYVNGNSWKWRLNRTRLKDQHLRLLAIETLFPVFYAFPNSHQPDEIASLRGRLLLKTFWFKPSQLRLPGGPVGHHDIEYDTSSRRWSIHSPEEPEPLSPLRLTDIELAVENSLSRENLLSLLKAINEVSSSLHGLRTDYPTRPYWHDASWLRGLSVFVVSRRVL